MAGVGQAGCQPVDRIRVRDEEALDLGTGWCQILHDAHCRKTPASKREPQPLGGFITTPNRRILSNKVSRSDSSAQEGINMSKTCLRVPCEDCESIRTGQVRAVSLVLRGGTCRLSRTPRCQVEYDITLLLPVPKLEGIWLALRSPEIHPGPMHIRHRSEC